MCSNAPGISLKQNLQNRGNYISCHVLSNFPEIKTDIKKSHYDLQRK